VQTIAFPAMPFDKWYTYVPNWAEIATSLMILAYGAVVVSLAYRYLPVFPQEAGLNKNE
jgi:molybdopterin-containing oxidoreductase family membrane subunit